MEARERFLKDVTDRRQLAAYYLVRGGCVAFKNRDQSRICRYVCKVNSALVDRKLFQRLRLRKSSYLKWKLLDKVSLYTDELLFLSPLMTLRRLPAVAMTRTLWRVGIPHAHMPHAQMPKVETDI